MRTARSSCTTMSGFSRVTMSRMKTGDHTYTLRLTGPAGVFHERVVVSP